MEKAELLPQIDAAIALLRAEVTELRLGSKDHCLQELVAADTAPLPTAQFEGLLGQWKPPAVPAELLELLRQLEEMDRNVPPLEAIEETKAEMSMEEDGAETGASLESVDEEVESDASAKEDEPATQEQVDEGEDTASANDDAEECSKETDTPDKPEEDEEAAMLRKQREAEAQAALLKLQTLRKSMMLDVLSKIVSVAKSKGVVRFSCRYHQRIRC